jgi:hypothetical protein
VERGTSEFSTTRPVQAVVTENVTSCVVDGVCGLRLEFSDTTVFALYGSGERPTPSCSIGVEVSDAAFAARPGASVTVVLEECVGLGLILREIRDPIGP